MRRRPKSIASNAVAAAIDATWGPGKSQDKAFVALLRSPFRKCSEKADRAGYKEMANGGVFIKPWSKQRPGVVDANVQPIMVPGDVWAGQRARASVNAFAYEMSGNKGISFGLNNVQICSTSGPRLDGRKAATEEFSTYAEEGELVGAGMDDEPPF
jgi:hypothetical protein